MKKAALVVVTAMVLLVAAILGVGALIPEAHTASLSVHYGADPEVVWESITGYEEFPAWRSGVDAVEPFEEPGGAAGWTEKGSTGTLPMVIDEAVAPRRLVLRIAADDLGFGGTWTYEVVAEDGGSRLTITEDGTVSNLLFRVMSRFVFGYTATIETYLIDLGRRLGEDVVPAPPAARP